MSKNKVSKKEVVDFLLKKAENESRLIVLFPNSKELRKANTDISQDIKNSFNYSFDRSTAFSVTNSMIRHDKNKVFLGLEMEKELLEGEYLEEEIKIYGEEEQ